MADFVNGMEGEMGRRGAQGRALYGRFNCLVTSLAARAIPFSPLSTEPLNRWHRWRLIGAWFCLGMGLAGLTGINEVKLLTATGRHLNLYWAEGRNEGSVWLALLVDVGSVITVRAIALGGAVS